MSIEERLARLEEGLAYANANDRLLASYMRRTAAREAMAEAAALEARLSPGALAELRSGMASSPDLGSPLMDRLRADGGLAGSVEGSGQAALNSANMLDDPTFNWCRDYSDLPAATAVKLGFWEITKDAATGTSPQVDLTIERTSSFHSGGVVALNASWTTASAGAVTVRLRSAAVGTASSYLTVDWPWLVAACRIMGRLVTSTWQDAITVTAVVRILSSGGTTLVESDPIDVGTIDAVKLEARPFVAVAPPESYSSERIEIAITFDYDGTSVSDKTQKVRIAEPQLTYSDEESPPLFEPALGRYNPIPDAVAARVIRTSDLSISNSTWTKLNLGSTGASEDYDTNALHDPSYDTGRRFELPATGLWWAKVQISWESNATGLRAVRIVRDKAGGGTREESREQHRAVSGAPTFMSCSSEFLAFVGDELYVEVWQDSGGSLNVLGAGAPDTHFQVRLVAWYNTDRQSPPFRPGRIV